MGFAAVNGESLPASQAIRPARCRRREYLQLKYQGNTWAGRERGSIAFRVTLHVHSCKSSEELGGEESGPEPRRRAVEELLSRVVSGTYPAGTALPGEAALASDLSVSA